MFPGSPARLRENIGLWQVAALARPGIVLGVWLRGCRRAAAVRVEGGAATRHLLLADDLGYLLARCAAIAVRDGEVATRMPASVLLGWRVLEVVLASPYLPAERQLRALFPSARVGEGVLALPIGLGSAEEALALCAAERLPVAGTRIRYLADKR